MADNITVTPGTGATVATDDVSGVQFQRVKLDVGADGASTPVTAAAPLPVVQTGTPTLPTGAATAANQASEQTLVGSVTETAPASDTASSGLNGRLQRIAQRLTSIIALLPASLGQKARASSLAVTLSSEDITATSTTSLLTTTAHDAAFGTAGTADAQVRSIQGIASMTPVQVSQATPGNLNMTVGAALPAGTNNIGQTSVAPQTANGLTTYHLVSAGSTNATVVKNGVGQLYGYYLYNANPVARKVAFHNSASAPTAGASVFFSIVIPGGSAANVEFTNGIAFSAGIGITTVTELADSGTTGVAAGDLLINLFYK